MKPTRFSVVACALVASANLSSVSSAAPETIYWDGSAVSPNNIWGNTANWSLTNGTASADPTAIPDGEDIVVLGFTGVTTTQTINLGADQAALGLATNVNLSNIHTLLGGGSDRTLTLGTSGINHTRGGLTIGSTTSGQKVNVVLAGSQQWISSTASGTGTIQAIFVHNDVSLGSASNETLTLRGTNTGSFINGNITNGSAGGVLSIIKADSGTWTLGGTSNTYSGTTSVNAGILRVTNSGAFTAANTSVAAGATLSLRTGAGGTAGFSMAEIETVRSSVAFAANSTLGIDTNNGNFDYTNSLAGGPNINKLGGNFLTLSGNNAAFTGSLTVSEGFLAFQSAANLTGGSVSVGASGTLLALAGGSGFTSAQIDSLRTSATYAVGGSFGISTTNGDFTYGSAMAGTVRFTKSGINTLYLTADNSTYSGGTVITNGTLSVKNLANGGTASSIGNSTNVATNLTLAGGRLQYTGAGSTTNRLFHLTSNSTIDSSGYGALVFSNTGSNTAAGASRTLTLTGYNTDANTISGIITNTENVTTVAKTGYGNWTLSGANSYTGNTRVRGGTLTFDYVTADPLSSNTAKNVVVNSGTVVFKAGGPRVSDTLGILTLGDAQNSLSTVRISNGMALTVSALDGSGNSQRHNLIDTSGAGNSLIVTKLNSSTTPGTNEHLKVTAAGLILNNANTIGNGRANIVFRANDGTYGFAAFAAGASSGTMQKLGNLTSVASSATITNNATNYLITAGSYTTTASADFSTLTFDSTGGAINFTLGSGHTLNSSSNGKAMLFSGSSDINITGGHATTTAISALWIHNYLDPSATLNLGVNWGNSTHMLVGGTGFTNYTGVGLGMSSGSDLVVDGGVFRVAADQNMAGYAGAARINDAVFEIGADLNGGTTGDFSGNTSVFRMTGNSGLSAYTAVDGGVRNVAFSTDLTWGASNFLINASDNTDGDYALLLSSARSNATIDLSTNINLNGRHRTVEVANGSAAVDARLSGNLTGGLSSGLTKVGTGTLSLTGTNTYQGGTRVDAGKLIVGGGGINATTSLHVRNSTVELAASGVINDAAVVTLENGIMTTNGGISETMGALTIIGDNQLNLIGVGNAIRFADSSAQVWSSTLAILDWSGLSVGGGDDQVYFGTTSGGLTGSQLSKITFVNPTLDGQSYTGNYGASILATGEIVAVIPEPSLVTLAFVGAGAAIFRRRRSA